MMLVRLNPVPETDARRPADEISAAVNQSRSFVPDLGIAPLRAVQRPAIPVSWEDVWAAGWRFQHREGPRQAWRWFKVSVVVAALMVHLLLRHSA